jgi:hypothetical protein
MPQITKVGDDFKLPHGNVAIELDDREKEVGGFEDIEITGKGRTGTVYRKGEGVGDQLFIGDKVLMPRFRGDMVETKEGKIVLAIVHYEDISLIWSDTN